MLSNVTISVTFPYNIIIHYDFKNVISITIYVKCNFHFNFYYNIISIMICYATL